MKKLILIIPICLSLLVTAQTSKPKVDTVLTMDTKIFSINDLYRKADMYKDSVIARQYENFMVLFNAILGQLINEQKKK